MSGTWACVRANDVGLCPACDGHGPCAWSNHASKDWGVKVMVERHELIQWVLEKLMELAPDPYDSMFDIVEVEKFVDEFVTKLRKDNVK